MHKVLFHINLAYSMNSSTEGKMDMTQIMTMQMWLKTLIIETTKQRSTSLHDVKGVMGNKHRNKLRRIKRDSPALSIRHSNLFLLFKQQTCHPEWGRGLGGGVTNSITGHYRCSVIDYLYPYKMPGSLVDQTCLASFDKMFPLNHHTRANNTFKYIRELSDKVLRV